MAQESSPAFQFYGKDFLTDEKQLVMSLEEVGAYARLLPICWAEGSIPEEIGKLARLVHTTPRTMAKLWPALQPCFRAHPVLAGRLVHPRLEKEREKQRRFRDRASKGGKARHADHGATSSVEADNKQELSSQEAELNLKSPISDLRSPVSDLHTPVRDARVRSSLIRGPSPKYAFQGKVPVPCDLHREFLSKYGGDEETADRAIRAWYSRIDDEWRDTPPIGDTSFVFWNARWAEWHGTTRQSVVPALSGKTTQMLAGASDILREIPES